MFMVGCVVGFGVLLFCCVVVGGVVVGGCWWWWLLAETLTHSAQGPRNCLSVKALPALCQQSGCDG